MNFPHIINTMLIVVLIICLVTDVRERKIYNMVTIPALISGLILNGAIHGLEGLLDSLKGTALVLIVLAVPFMAGGIGAGDVKLLMAVGAINGFTFAFEAVLATFLTGGIIAVILIIKRGIMKDVLGRLTANLYLFIALPVFKRQVSEKNTFQDQQKYAFPYGIAIFIGTVFVLLFR